LWGCIEDKVICSNTMNLMLLIIQNLKSHLISFGSVVAQLDWAIKKEELDYPVKLDNDKHWNRVRYE
jgi:hypothetical protein